MQDPPDTYVLEERADPPPIRGVESGVAGFVGATARGPAEATLVTSFNDFEVTYGGFVDAAPFVTPYWRLPYAVRAFFENGGRRAWIVRVLDPMSPASPTDADAVVAGLRQLSAVADVELVTAPDDVLVAAFGDAVAHACDAAGDRLAIVNVPASPDPRVSPPPHGSSHTARYFPPLRVPAAHLPAGYALVPPCGHVMGRLAATPVGTSTPPDSRLASGSVLPDDHASGLGPLEVGVTSAHADALVRAGVNALRDFRQGGRGVLLWGGRTATSDPEWKYVNVRRLFAYLERSIDRGTQWAVFEPNDEPLWMKVRIAIERFLTTRWREGALAGVTPQQAFFVRCDRTTMTQDDIDNGRLVVLIGVAPLRPSEFVIFRIGQWTADHRD